MTRFSKLHTIENTYSEAFCVGNNIIVFSGLKKINETRVYCYSVDKRTWSNVDLGFVKTYMD